MSERKAQILMASVIIARSTAYLFSKTLLQTMDRFTVLANRFLLAFLLLCILFFRRMIRTAPRTLLRGMILGTVFFIVMSFELGALKTAETSTTSFLENTAIIYVPLLAALVSFRLPGSGTEWFCLAALVFVCTGFGFTLQPVAQKYLRPEQASIFCALGPVSATITGALILHESITPCKLLGAALILGSILIPKELLCRHNTVSAKPAALRSRC